MDQSRRGYGIVNSRTVMFQDPCGGESPRSRSAEKNRPHYLIRMLAEVSSSCNFRRNMAKDGQEIAVCGGRFVAMSQIDQLGRELI